MKKPNLRKGLLPHQRRYLPAVKWLMGYGPKAKINPHLNDPDYEQRFNMLPDRLKKTMGNCGSGKTYLLAVCFLEISLEGDGEWVPIWDHAHGGTEWLVRQMEGIVVKLGLGFEYDARRKRIRCWQTKPILKNISVPKGY